MMPQSLDWNWIANKANTIVLDAKSKMAQEKRTKYILIALGAAGALFFMILFSKGK